MICSKFGAERETGLGPLVEGGLELSDVTISCLTKRYTSFSTYLIQDPFI